MIFNSENGFVISESTDIERVVIASIDRHSIVSTKIERLSTDMSTVCQPRVDRDVDRVLIAGRSRCRSPVSIDTRSRVSIVHMIPLFLFKIIEAIKTAKNTFILAFTIQY